MGKYAIIIILGAIVLLFPLINTAHRVKSESLEKVFHQYDIRTAQNAASSYTTMVLYNINQATKDGTYDIDNFNYTETATQYDNSVITVKVDSIAEGKVRVRVNAQNGKIIATTEVYDNQIPFSYYAQFFNSFNNLYYGNGEGIDGPFYVNGHLGIAQVPGPVFLGNVTSTQSIKYAWGATEENFHGFKGDVNSSTHTPIPMPDLNFLDKASAYHLDNLFPSISISDLYLNLTDDGSGNGIVEVYALPLDDPKLLIADSLAKYRRIVCIDSLESNKDVIYSAAKNLHLQGTLNGQLSISTEKNVFIDDDTVYKSDPRIHDDSTDILGIICTGDVVISTREKDNTPGQYYNADGVLIMAHIFTVNTVRIENLSWSSWEGPKNRGEFYTYGGRIQGFASATWSGWGDYIGYKEKITYDTRFRKIRPPEVPFTTDRKISRWRETYTISSS